MREEVGRRRRRWRRGGGWRKHLFTLMILMSFDSEICLVFFRLSAEAGVKAPL